MSNNNFTTVALRYAKRGWAVFPCYGINNGVCTCEANKDCNNPGKHPRTEHGFKDATTDVETIKKWWQMWPTANIGWL